MKETRKSGACDKCYTVPKLEKHFNGKIKQISNSRQNEPVITTSVSCDLSTLSSIDLSTNIDLKAMVQRDANEAFEMIKAFH